MEEFGQRAAVCCFVTLTNKTKETARAAQDEQGRICSFLCFFVFLYIYIYNKPLLKVIEKSINIATKSLSWQQ